MKRVTVIFSSAAIDDVEQAVAYYEEKQVGLGKRFAAHVQVALNSIKRNPHFASVCYDTIRCARIKKFPFLVHYHIDEDALIVSIIAVYSTYKKPLW
ncbi:MAG: type II toxin-antitoxin system RelE/ParE family toxin [Bacteroidota bacterium]|nr:type II toxin-antitoxin system RelE/ParE family toxin [Bacteroidota bacterium]